MTTDEEKNEQEEETETPAWPFRAGERSVDAATLARMRGVGGVKTSLDVRNIQGIS